MTPVRQNIVSWRAGFAIGDELILDQLDLVVLGYLRKEDALRPRSVPALAAQFREFNRPI